ncbi:MAG: UPF0175 family protein [Nitrososphaerales archaeon]
MSNEVKMLLRDAESLYHEALKELKVGRLRKALDEVVREESVDKSTAVRLLVDLGYKEWKLKRALQKLQEGKASIWKASEMAGMSLWDFLAIVKKEGVEWVDFEVKEALQILPYSSTPLPLYT